MFTLASHKPHFQKQRFQTVHEKSVCISISAQKKKKVKRKKSRSLSIGGFVPSVIHFGSTWAAQRNSTARFDGTDVCSGCAWEWGMVLLRAALPYKHRSQWPRPRPAPSSSPSASQRLSHPSRVPALLQGMIECRGCHYAHGFVLSLLASSIKSEESPRQLIKVESRAGRKV